MIDDFSNIPTSGCNVLNSPTTIYNYNNGQRRTYYQVGGKWYFSSLSTYSTMPSGAQCLNSLDLSSKAEFYPVYIFIAFMLALSVWALWWFIWRRWFKWRI